MVTAWPAVSALGAVIAGYQYHWEHTALRSIAMFLSACGYAYAAAVDKFDLMLQLHFVVLVALALWPSGAKIYVIDTTVLLNSFFYSLREPDGVTQLFLTMAIAAKLVTGYLKHRET